MRKPFSHFILEAVINDLFGPVESFNFIQLRLILEAVAKTGFTVDRAFYFNRFLQALGRTDIKFRAIKFTADDTMRALDSFNEQHGSVATVYGGFCATIENVIDTLAKNHGIKFRDELEHEIFHRNLVAVVEEQLTKRRAVQVVVEEMPDGKKRNVRRWGNVPLATAELPTDSGIFAPTVTAYSTHDFLDRLEKDKP
jgi:hypothetical protein